MAIQMNRRRCRLALIAVAAMVPSALWAVPIEQITNPRLTPGNWVSDGANILRDDTEVKLNTLIQQLQATNGSEMAVVTLPDSKPAASPKELTTKLFNTWGIGQKGKNNGILLLISVADRRVEIETGYGMEEILPDAKVGQIIQQRITPKFKAGDFDGGTLAGTEAIVKIAQGKEVEDPSDPWLIGLVPILFILAWICLMIGFIASTYQQNRSNGMARWAQNTLASLQGLAGLAFVHGLGQSVKLKPRQSSRVRTWHLAFERLGSLRCAACGSLLEPVDHGAVEELLKPSEKAAESIGSLEFRGWRCSKCAPEEMHLRVYESTSDSFAFCPHCHELTVQKDDPYIIPEPTLSGRNLRITNSHCVNCDYANQEKEFVQSWIASDGSSGGGSSSSDGGFSGGSSGGGGAGGDW